MLTDDSAISIHVGVSETSTQGPSERVVKDPDEDPFNEEDKLMIDIHSSETGTSMSGSSGDTQSESNF